MRSLVLAFCLAASAPAQAADTSAVFGEQLVRLINDYRVEQGLAPMALANELVELAQEHSQAMATQERLSHDGFEARARRAGSKVCVENVAWNHPTAQTVLGDWRQSTSHRFNLLDPKLLRVGIARSAGYVTFFACR
jgi:uncharacterized protein YkwD